LKFILLLLLFISSQLFSQEIKNLDQSVVGMVTSNEGTFLILENGYLQISRNDSYIDYYRKIYKDSTIVNPNTEIKSDYNINFIPYLSPAQNNNKIDFSQPMNLGILIQFNKSKDLQLTNFGENLIDSLASKK
jgi:hypothetical protein